MKKQLLLMLAGLSMTAQAQTLMLDTTFANGGKLVLDNIRGLSQIIKTPSGKLIIVGAKTSGNGQFAVEQYLANGTIDNTFGTNGTTYVGFNGGGDIAKAVALQSDGKIIVGGSCSVSSSNNDKDFAITRLNADGTVDSTFATNGRFTYDNNNFAFDQVSHLAVQSDNKIIFAGGAGSTNMIGRLNTDGTFDNTFGTNGKYSGGGLVGKLILASDGSIYTATTGGLSAGVRKITSAGINDPSFLNGNNYSESVVMAPQTATLLQLSSGKLLLYAFNNIMGSVFTLLNTDGTVDSATFGKAVPSAMGFGSKVNINTLLELSGGKIISAGYYNASSINQIYCVSRFDLNTKRVDSTFADSGYFKAFSHQPSNSSKNEYLNQAILAQDGDLLLAGNTCSGSCIPVIYKYKNDAGSNPPTGLSNAIKNKLQASVYPNPSNGIVHILVETEATIELSNIQGKVVLNSTLDKGQNNLTTNELKSGVYFYTITDSKGNTAKGKLMVN